MKCGKIADPSTLPHAALPYRGKDLTGRTFGALEILRPVGSQQQKTVWLCRCSCGAHTTATGSNLTCGKMVSCGCAKLTRIRLICFKKPNDFKVNKDGSLTITLTGRSGTVTGYATIDEVDRDLLKYRWSIDSAGYAATGNRNSPSRKLHRAVVLAMGLSFDGDKEVDHIDGDRSNNRRQNLRVVTSRQNTWHVTKTRAISGYKGVSASFGKWAAIIRKDNVYYRLGRFSTPEKAARAYNEAAVKLFGEYAHLNVLPASNDLDASDHATAPAFFIDTR